MNVISKLFLIPIVLLALGTSYGMGRLLRIQAPKHRFAAIDGLRGYLAIFVFLHHSSIWYYFHSIHEWSHLPSSLFNHLGSTSVALFFMITAFLFFSRLIDARGSDFDW